jgi:hypothetical protein
MERTQQQHKGADLAMTSPHATEVYVCEDCSKRYAVVPGDGLGAVGMMCTCGGDLIPVPLEPGVYELEGSRRSPKGGQGSDAREADLGYNESHGYGPSHGGPTGPGDAPAVDAPAAPIGDEDEEATARGDA